MPSTPPTPAAVAALDQIDAACREAARKLRAALDEQAAVMTALASELEAAASALEASEKSRADMEPAAVILLDAAVAQRQRITGSRPGSRFNSGRRCR